jgi:hypothetical protein
MIAKTATNKLAAAIPDAMDVVCRIAAVVSAAAAAGGDDDDSGGA